MTESLIPEIQMHQEGISLVGIQKFTRCLRYEHGDQAWRGIYGVRQADRGSSEGLEHYFKCYVDD